MPIFKLIAYLTENPKAGIRLGAWLMAYQIIFSYILYYNQYYKVLGVYGVCALIFWSKFVHGWFKMKMLYKQPVPKDFGKFSEIESINEVGLKPVKKINKSLNFLTITAYFFALNFSIIGLLVFIGFLPDPVSHVALDEEPIDTEVPLPKEQEMS